MQTGTEPTGSPCKNNYDDRRTKSKCQDPLQKGNQYDQSNGCYGNSTCLYGIPKNYAMQYYLYCPGVPALTPVADRVVGRLAV